MDLIASLGTGVVLQGRFPIAARSLATPPSDAERAWLDTHNEAVLRVLLQLDEQSTVVPDESDALSSELGRIERKLDLVIELMGQLLQQRESLPPARDLAMSAETICWNEPSAATVAGLAQIRVHLNSACPNPLILTGHAVCDPAVSNRAVLQFDDLSAATRDMLERLVFRFHRRSVAQTRSRPQGATSET